MQTTTFAALIAAMGLAIGMAWAGLLANFAAGAFLLVLRPFKVGDLITAAGITGTVHEPGLFVTTFDTPDNDRTFVGNNKVFSDSIQNFTANPYRRVESTAQISGAADPRPAIARLKERLAAIPNVANDPAPDVTILTFTPFGPVLAVRPTATTTSIGRSISTPTWPFAKCWAIPHSPPLTRWQCRKARRQPRGRSPPGVGHCPGPLRDASGSAPARRFKAADP